MAFGSDRKYMTSAQADAAQIDVGLRQYMLKVYNMMALGLGLTGLVALLVANNPAIFSLFFQRGASGAIGPNLLGWVALLAPVGLALWLSFRIHAMRASSAATMFYVYAGLMGISLSMYLQIYTGVSVARTFFITASAFAGLSLWGYVTKKDLSGFGSFLIMGLWGLIIASLVNIFLQSSMMDFVISAVGVLLFAGLTAYDTQKIKEMYFEADDGETASKKAIFGALTLYLDFINLFIYLLRFLGDRR
ncbi:MAG: hypothetical protein BGO92_15565 [Magnetospirillum sp. 64-120]|uniref:Bax inhibitor-1/YccA family protein n=2 Tax=Magnetospirillum TaxID=13134 RepID=UPI000926D696|nr:Bax inhibitor-1/YccA family protein [Magnetospirillum sp. 64-120]OJX81754.1 MAG: hypothetical protein BGO92_15565 [Magnetospirillum sp. 64-120]